MKRKRVKNVVLPVRCSFCGAPTEYQIVGGQHGGRTACDNCYNELRAREQAENERESLGEQQAYRNYRVY